MESLSIDPKIEMNTLQALINNGPPPLFATIGGAHLYGFQSPDSDVDLRGSFVLPLDDVLRLKKPEETLTISEMHNHVEIDWVAHDIHKYWNHYQTWRRNRNPTRADLEAHYGYDTKHAMHLFRLLKMGEETLHDGTVRVLRPDADWLLSVRDGSLPYEEVIRLASEHEARLTALIEESPLPLEPDTSAAETLLIELQESFLFN